MPPASVAPYFALMLLYLAAARLIVRKNGFYARTTAPAGGGRYESLDGLRGFLALGVFFHHAVVTRAYYVTGKWELPAGFYGLLGPSSVRFFFIITGFLFWSKAIHDRGRTDAIKFWKKRLLRIGPMCLFSVFIMLMLVAVQSHFQLRQPLRSLMPRAAACCLLGAMKMPTVNGVDPGRFNAHVFWTLGFEWEFYLVFPLLAWFALPRRLACLAASAALVCLWRCCPGAGLSRSTLCSAHCKCCSSIPKHGDSISRCSRCSCWA